MHDHVASIKSPRFPRRSFFEEQIAQRLYSMEWAAVQRCLSTAQPDADGNVLLTAEKVGAPNQARWCASMQTIISALRENAVWAIGLESSILINLTMPPFEGLKPCCDMDKDGWTLEEFARSTADDSVRWAWTKQAGGTPRQALATAALPIWIVPVLRSISVKVAGSDVLVAGVNTSANGELRFSPKWAGNDIQRAKFKRIFQTTMAQVEMMRLLRWAELAGDVALAQAGG